MIALEVSLNKEHICTAGTEDLQVLTANITACGRLGSKTISKRDGESIDLFYSVGGLTGRPNSTKDVHVRWKSVAALKIGDVVTIKIVEASKCDRPKSRKRAERSKRK